MARLLGERKGLFAGNLVLRLVKDLLPFVGPILIGIVVDLLSGRSGRDRSLFGIELSQNDVRSIVIVAIAMAILAVAKAAVSYVHTIVSAHTGRHVVQAARRDLARATMQMSLDERRRFNSGDLLDRCLADSKGLRGFTQNVIIRLISNTVRAVFPVVYMFSIDPLLALVVLAVIPLQSGISAILQRRLQRQTHEARTREALHTSSVKEAIDGWNDVASVGGQDWAAQGIHQTAAASEDAKIVKKHTTAWISAVISLCTAFGIAIVYAIGGWRIINSGVLDGTNGATAGALTLGTLTAFIGVAKKTYSPFQAYTKILSSYRTGLVNLERIADVLDAPMIDPREDGPTLQVTQGDITLDDVSFTYHDGTTPVLRELTGVIPGQSLTVITGSSGAGKTTLLRLLLGLDVPGTGTVSIDSQDINVARFETVQKAIALVPQEPMLFTGTMGENLLLGLENITTTRLLEACDQAGLLDMVRTWPKGLDTEVGSGKQQLSGGQLRRMSIARALLRQPSILLLDEPTTGLDDDNSALVLSTLRQISSHTTVVMVSHRSEPLKASDHHLILSDGGWTNSVDHHAQTPRAGRAVSPNVADLAQVPANGTVPTNGEVHSNGRVPANGETSTNGEAPTNGQFPENGEVTPAVYSAPPEPAPVVSGHAMIKPVVLALSAMGRPITLTGVDHPEAATRVLLVSGHRAGARPITAISPQVFSQVARDTQAMVAMASIEDVNPDGAFSSQRDTALDIRIDADHATLAATETRALHAALDAWRTDLVIDVAEHPVEPEIDAHVALRFHPTTDGGAPPEALALAQAIRAELDRTSQNYRMSLLGATPGSLAAERRDLRVVEILAQNTSEQNIITAIVTAAVCTYRAKAASAVALA